MVPTEPGGRSPSNLKTSCSEGNERWKIIKPSFKLMRRHECVDYKEFIHQNKWAVKNCSILNIEENFRIDPNHFGTYQSSKRSGCYERIVVEEYCPHKTDFLEQLKIEQEKMRIMILKIEELKLSNDKKLKQFRAVNKKPLSKLVPWWLSLALLVLSLPVLADATVLDRPALFGKSQRTDKLIMKHQIGYHFKKTVRQVSQELFVSRKMDVSTLFLGIHVLNHTAQELGKYC